MKGFIPTNLHPFFKLLLFFAFLAGGICVGMFVAMIGLMLFYGLSIPEITAVTQNPKAYPYGRGAMLLYQVCTHFFLFTVGPLLFLAITEAPVKRYLFAKKTYLGLVLLSAAFALLIIPANSWLISWNADLHLPDFLKSFEIEARLKEDFLAELTKYLTRFDTIGQMLAGMLAFALIPAIGEELVFRGIVQRNLIRWADNPHVAIWATAFLFGAIHMQFFGFFPRMALGVVFGYLYYWSGNLWVPIAAHFMNNGFTVLMLYLKQHHYISANVESTEAMPWEISLMSLLVSLAVLFYLKQRFTALPETSPEQ